VIRNETTNSANLSQNGLGGRLPLLSRAELDEEQQKLYDAMTKAILPEAEAGGFTARLADGRFIGPFNALLRVPKISSAMGPWTAQIANSGIAEDVRHVVILAVGAAWAAGYEIAAHSSAARGVGVPAAAIDAIIRKQEPSGLTAEANVAYRLTVSLLDHRAVAGNLYRESLDTFGEDGVIAILALIGQYQFISSILNCFEVPTPDDNTRRR